jgi:hypothetical protein
MTWAAATVEEKTERPSGGQPGNQNAAKDQLQTNGNNIPIRSKRPEGTSAAKALRRLRKQRPDLHAKAVAVLLQVVVVVAYIVPTCRAQTLHVNAGSDGIEGVAGGYVEAFWPNGWDTLAGYGDSGFGFAARKQIPYGLLALGDSMVLFSTPGVGVSVPVRGFAYQMKNGLTVFAGATGNSFTEPFFEMQNKFSSLGAGFVYHREFHGLTLAGSALTVKHKNTAIASLNEKQRHWTAYLSGGLLNGQRTLDLGATGSLWILNGAASRSTLIVNGLRTSFDSTSLGASLRSLGVGSSRYESQTTSGDSVWTNWRMTDDLSVRGEYLTARGQKVLDVGILERIGERITLSPGATRANGSWSWTIGGSFASNIASVSANYEELFLPFATKNPWQKTLLLAVTFGLPSNARATVRSFVTPQGKIKWVAYGDQYLAGPMGETASGATLIPHFEKYVISGTVVDEKSRPVFGAAVRVGKTLLFTDDAGTFEIRVKNQSYPVTLILEEFSAPGKWHVVSCPASASPGDPIKITVAKL